jgi:hypothetical protein
MVKAESMVCKESLEILGEEPRVVQNRMSELETE